MTSLDREQARRGALLALTLVGGYFAIDYLTTARTARLLALPLDARIPFVPAFAPVYVSVYVVYALPLLLVRRRAFFRAALEAYGLVMGVAFACFLAMPVILPRPVDPGPGFAGWVLSLVYRLDQPYNCFPSLHVAMAVLASLLLLRAHRGYGLPILAASLVIAASTLLVKQHYLLDVLSGLALAWLADRVFFLRRWRALESR